MMNAATMTDIELKATCFNALTELVGHIGMERFIVMMSREPHDYTKWRDAHFDEPGETIEELGAKIKAFVPPHRRASTEEAPATV